MDHGPTLEKSHVHRGNPYAPGDVQLILLGVRGLPACRGHAILWHTISLSVQLCTHYQWSCVFSQTLPGISVMLHSLQRSPVVPPWAKRDCPSECRWLVAQCDRVRGDFSAEAHYGLSHYGRKPNTTSGSRWSKGKANINSYDCWLWNSLQWAGMFLVWSSKLTKLCPACGTIQLQHNTDVF